MSVPPVKLNNIGGGCPHGLPGAACPICSGMGGGGGANRKNKSEMTWDQCFNIGLALKSAQNNVEINRQDALMTLLAAFMENRQVSAFTQKLLNAVNFVGSIITSPIVNIVNNLKNNLTKQLEVFSNNFSNLVQRLSNNLRQMMNNFTNIMDKLAAIFGEQEKNLRDTVSKNLDRFKKKLFSFFSAIDASMDQGEQEKEESEYNSGELKYE